MNLIGDIQGNYHTLRALLKQMPDEEPVSVGDMVDRGPRSKEVLEFFRLHGKALLGNHEHMMLDYFKGTEIYMPHIWLLNSGDATLYLWSLSAPVPFLKSCWITLSLCRFLSRRKALL